MDHFLRRCPHRIEGLQDLQAFLGPTRQRFFSDRINPPITPENEAKLKSLGVDIAPEVLELLRVFDGTTEYLFDTMFFCSSFGPPGEPTISWYIELFMGRVEEAAFDGGDDSGWSTAVRSVTYSRAWTPFISTIDGDTWFVDHDPAPDGVSGQVFRMDVAQGCGFVEVAAPSLVDLLEKLAATQ